MGFDASTSMVTPGSARMSGAHPGSSRSYAAHGDRASHHEERCELCSARRGKQSASQCHVWYPLCTAQSIAHQLPGVTEAGNATDVVAVVAGEMAVGTLAYTGVIIVRRQLGCFH